MHTFAATGALLVWALPAFGAQARPAYTCATCHQQARTQPLTSMGQALHLAQADPLLKTHPKMAVQKGQFSYSIVTQDGKTTYTVSDGKNTISVPVKWAFGAQSQTYVLERGGRFYESLVSYFKGLDALDTTIGDQVIHPTTLEQAFGRPLANSEITSCFGCHSTGTVTDHQLHFGSFHPGVTCEHCHAGAQRHLQGFLDGDPVYKPPDLKKLSPEQISTFCGQCHRTWQTVMRNKWLGPINVRFDPYRLALSKCYDGVDRRLSCIGCHDPHKQVDMNDKDYDRKCVACHSPGAQLSLGMIKTHPHATSMPVCPVSKRNCVSCHMPKVPLPGGHQPYTDHFIRIVKKGATYAD